MIFIILHRHHLGKNYLKNIRKSVGVMNGVGGGAQIVSNNREGTGALPFGYL